MAVVCYCSSSVDNSSCRCSENTSSHNIRQDEARANTFASRCFHLGGRSLADPGEEVAWNLSTFCLMTA